MSSVRTPSPQVGLSLARKEAQAKLTGTAPYGHHVTLPGMLHGKIVRSTVAHGRIRRIDTRAAKEIPGMHRVLTAEDIRALIPHPHYGPAFHDQPILAIDKVRYADEPVALVLAADPHVADTAAGLVEVAYDPLPAVYDEVEAMSSESIVHEVLKPAGTVADLEHLDGKRDINVALDFHLQCGDPAKGFAAAAHVFEHTFRTQQVLHLPLQPFGSAAAPPDDLFAFSAPLLHEGDGGRHIGAGCMVVTRNHDTGWISVGTTCRAMIHDRKHVGLDRIPGKHGAIQHRKYMQAGKRLAVRIVIDTDPLGYLVSGIEVPFGTCECNHIGAILGESVAVVPGQFTGLPIPAAGEIVHEGYAEPGDELIEGPFGDFHGYYRGKAAPPLGVRIDRVYFRNVSIIVGTPPTCRTCKAYGRRKSAVRACRRVPFVRFPDAVAGRGRGEQGAAGGNADQVEGLSG